MPGAGPEKLSPAREFVERLRFTLVALLVSTFPASAKEKGWPALYSSVPAHVFSGWVETLVSAALFVVGLLAYVTSFSHGAGWTYLSNLPSSTIWDWRGVGVIGYLSYLLTPPAWVTLFCFVEGIVRSLDAALSQRVLGVAFVVLPWRAADAVRLRMERRRTEALLGPERPDEVVQGEPGAAVALTVFAAREKPWRDGQALEYLDDFYTAAGRRLVLRGRHHVYRYDLRHLPHGEVIRGVLVRYDPRQEAPRPDEPESTKE